MHFKVMISGSSKINIQSPPNVSYMKKAYDHYHSLFVLRISSKHFFLFLLKSIIYSLYRFLNSIESLLGHFKKVFLNCSANLTYLPLFDSNSLLKRSTPDILGVYEFVSIDFLFGTDL